MPRFNREVILTAALRVACRRDGLSKMTRSSIAKEAGCADGLVSRYLGSMDEIRKSVIKQAIKECVVDLVAQGVASSRIPFKKLSEDLKRKVFAHISGE